MKTIMIGNGVKDEIIKILFESIETNQSLKKILLLENNITDKSAIFISKFLSQNESLEVLDLSVNKIGSIGALKIFKSLNNNKCLKEINLSKNSLENFGFFSVLNSNSTLESINLSDSNLREKNLEDLSKHLRGNCFIKKICLRNTNFSKNGFISLFSSLQNNKSVEYIDISGNGSSFDCNIVLKCFEKNKTISHFICDENWIGSEFLESFLKVISYSENVTHLSFIKNDLSEEISLFFPDFLKNNFSIVFLDLQQNNFSHFAVEKILSSLGSNSSLRFFEYSLNTSSGDLKKKFTQITTKNKMLYSLKILLLLIRRRKESVISCLPRRLLIYFFRFL